LFSFGVVFIHFGGYLLSRRPHAMKERIPLETVAIFPLQRRLIRQILFGCVGNGGIQVPELPFLVGDIHQILFPPVLDKVNVFIAIALNGTVGAFIDVGGVLFKGIGEAVIASQFDAFETDGFVERLDGVAGGLAELRTDLIEEGGGFRASDVLFSADGRLSHEGVGLAAEGANARQFDLGVFGAEGQ